MNNPSFGEQLAAVWADLANRAFTCTDAAYATQRVTGGRVMGYWHDQNPAATLGNAEGGHDFLIVDGTWLIDFWAAAYYGEMPILNLEKDEQEIARLYGDRDKWEEVDHALEKNFKKDSRRENPI